MRKFKVKTIDINCKDWFDKVNGNSYFAGSITVNLQLKNEITFKIPYQYGYGSQYIYTGFRILIDNKIITCEDNDVYWTYCDKNKVILRNNLQKNCKKAELINN